MHYRTSGPTHFAVWRAIQPFQFADYTPLIMDGRFVRKIPAGLAEEVIAQVRGIRFTPKRVDGKPISEWVMVNTEFHYSEPADCPSCNSLEVTVITDTGTLWHGYSYGRGWVKYG